MDETAEVTVESREPLRSWVTPQMRRLSASGTTGGSNAGSDSLEQS